MTTSVHNGFINLTPHEINIQSANGGTYHIPASGLLARVRTQDEPQEPIKLDWGGDIQVIKRCLGGVDFPKEVLTQLKTGPKALLLVSTMVLEALQRDDLGEHRHLLSICYCPDSGPTAIRDEKGQIKAVRRLIK